MPIEGGWAPPPPPAPPRSTAHFTESPYATGAAASAGTAGMWAFGITAYVALTDGMSPEDYAAPNSAAMGFLMIALLIVLPIAALIVYVIARAIGVRRGVAVLAAQVPSVVTAVWLAVALPHG